MTGSAKFAHCDLFHCRKGPRPFDTPEKGDRSAEKNGLLKELKHKLTRKQLQILVYPPAAQGDAPCNGG
jgi:hypothetical protein